MSPALDDFVLLRFWARAPEDLSAIEVIYIIIIIKKSQQLVNVI